MPRLCALLVLLLASAPLPTDGERVAAHEHSYLSEEEHAAGQDEEGEVDRFELMDLNQDGVISRHEWEVTDGGKLDDEEPTGLAEVGAAGSGASATTKCCSCRGNVVTKATCGRRCVTCRGCCR